MAYSSIQGLGAYFPSAILSNHDLEEILDTSDDWIKGRTGIEERRVSATESNQDLAVKAVLNLIEHSIKGYPVEYIIVATNTNKRKFPGTAMFVHREVSAQHPEFFADNISGYDVTAGCAGINHALMHGDALIRAGVFNSVLVIGTDSLTSVTDYADRQTAVLFGDGAGAYHLQASDSAGFVGHQMSGNSSGYESIHCKPDVEKIDLASAWEMIHDGELPIKSTGHVLQMDGRAVYKYVVGYLSALITGFEHENKKLNPEQISFDDIAAVIPHQANLRILEAVEDRHPGFIKKCRNNIQRFANTSTASQILSLMYFLPDAKPRDHVLMVGYGSGLISGANLYRMSGDLRELGNHPERFKTMMNNLSFP